MSELQNFRSAFNGFNREDVVHYIEYINNKHKAELSQLNTEIQTLQAELSLLRLTAAQADNSLAPQLEQEQAARAALEQELAEVKAQLAHTPTKDHTNEELEAYRRAERVERMAQERASQICDQANGMLAEASVKIDEAAAHIGSMADDLAAQLGALQEAVLGSKQTLHDAAAAMYAIRPVSADE